MTTCDASVVSLSSTSGKGSCGVCYIRLSIDVLLYHAIS